MSKFKNGIKEGGLVLGVSFFLAILFNIFSSNAIPWITEKKQKSIGADNSELGLESIDSTGKTSILGSGVNDTSITSIDSSVSNNIANSTRNDSLILNSAISIAKRDSQVNAANMQFQKLQLDSGLKASNKLLIKDSLKRVALIKDSIKKAALKAELSKKDSIKALKASNQAGTGVVEKSNPPEESSNCEKIKEITTEQAKGLFDKKNGVIFVDARPENQFQEGHIPNSMHAYGDQFSSFIPKFLPLPRSTILVCYCGGGDECHLSHEAAKGLCQLGFKKVFVYKGGSKEWNQNNYPWEK